MLSCITDLICSFSVGERGRDGAHSGGAGVVPRRPAARGGGAAAARGRGLPGAGDHAQPGAPAGALRLLGAAQALYRADHAGGNTRTIP